MKKIDTRGKARLIHDVVLKEILLGHLAFTVILNFDRDIFVDNLAYRISLNNVLGH